MEGFISSMIERYYGCCVGPERDCVNGYGEEGDGEAHLERVANVCLDDHYEAR